MKDAIFILLLSTAIAACGTSCSPPTRGASSGVAASAPRPAAAAPAAAPASELPTSAEASSAPADHAAVEGAGAHVTSLSGKLLAAAAASDGNVVLSPLGLHAALTLVQGGASGATARELDTLLGAPADAASLEALAALHAELLAPREGVTLRLANAFFVARGYAPAASYQSRVAAPLHARVDALDFEAPAVAARSIDAWVSNATEGQISALVPADALSSATAAVLANALYFHGTWKTPFRAEATAPAAFTRRSGERIDVPTMHATLDAPFAALDGLELVELPYADDRLAMAFVVPTQGKTTKDALVALENGAIERALRGAATTSLALAIPKLALDGAVMELEPVLRALGVRRVFGDQAELDRLLAQPAPLQLDDVLHRVRLDVNEQGATAAAASAAHVVFRSRAPTPRPFAADRPFLLLVRDRATGTPLIVGRIEDPSR